MPRLVHSILGDNTADKSLSACRLKCSYFIIDAVYLEWMGRFRCKKRGGGARKKMAFEGRKNYKCWVPKNKSVSRKMQDLVYCQKFCYDIRY